MDKNMFKYINSVLNDLEEEFNIEILYAVESGSRAWGYNNQYSDYDIRFIYRKPLEEYLTIHPTRDVIDYQNLKDWKFDYPLDFSGWDIRKDLWLHFKSNPNLREWIDSPIVYRGDSDNIFKDLPSFDISTLGNHYASMAYKMSNKYLNSTIFDMKYIKKQLTVIRCICNWILINNYNINNPPLDIYKLLEFPEIKETIKMSVIDKIMFLLDYYRSGCCIADVDITDTVVFLNEQFIKLFLNIIFIDVEGESRSGSYYLSYDNCFRRLIL